MMRVVAGTPTSAAHQQHLQLFQQVLVDLLAAGDQDVGVEHPVHEKVLDNGLKVLVKRDDRAPIVTSQVWYKVGSSYEFGGFTGVSHVLEHMMFKGTENLEPGEFSRIIAANGGDENAFTGRDYTAYFQTMAADRLAVSFELEAERMRRLALPEEEFLKELEVVKEERRLRTDDDPESLTFEQFNAAAYEASPYRIPIIGWASDLDSMQVGDLRDWYRQWYAPNNATLVVVGDVDPEQVFALAEEHFGPLQPEQIAAPKPRAKSPSSGVRSASQVKAPRRSPTSSSDTRPQRWVTPSPGSPTRWKCCPRCSTAAAARA
jgi:zinc protease